MRILVSVDPEIPVPPRTYGGIERIVAVLVTALQQSGHDVGLIAHPESTCKVASSYAWASLQSSYAGALGNMRVLHKAVGDFRPDVFHSFSRILYMLPTMRSSLPKIMSFQREPTARTVALAAALSNGVMTFTGCSEYICRQGKGAGGSWHAIHNFVDTEFYQFRADVARDAPLVFLSRIDRIKGAHNAIAVARRVGRRLIIAGNYADTGPEFEYWLNEIAPQLGGDIEYIGPVDDAQKNKLLGQAAAMIVPIEWNEPFGIVFAESLACGTPVISCPRGALPEIVRSGIDGFLVKTIEEACDAVANLDKIDRNACRQRAEQCFSVPVIVGQYERLYYERLTKRQ